MDFAAIGAEGWTCIAIGIAFAIVAVLSWHAEGTKHGGVKFMSSIVGMFMFFVVLSISHVLTGEIYDFDLFGYLQDGLNQLAGLIT